MYYYAYPARPSLVLAWTGDSLGIALMIGGVGAALVLAALALRGWRRREIRVKRAAVVFEASARSQGVPVG